MPLLWGCPPGTEIMNLLESFEIVGCSLGIESLDGLDQICLKPVKLYVLLAL